jgi:hypothetical protein
MKEEERRSITPDEELTFIQLWNQGASYQAIAQAFRNWGHHSMAEGCEDRQVLHPYTEVPP